MHQVFSFRSDHLILSFQRQMKMRLTKTKDGMLILIRMWRTGISLVFFFSFFLYLLLFHSNPVRSKVKREHFEPECRDQEDSKPVLWCRRDAKLLPVEVHYLRHQILTSMSIDEPCIKEEKD